VGGKLGELTDPGITSEVVWRVAGNSLTREETLKAAKPVSVERWWMAVPTTAKHEEVSYLRGQRKDLFETDDLRLEVVADATWPLKVFVQAPGDSPLGRAPRGALPLHLVYETTELKLLPGQPARFRLALKVEERRH
jgi:hypothetical protein